MSTSQLAEEAVRRATGAGKRLNQGYRVLMDDFSDMENFLRKSGIDEISAVKLGPRFDRFQRRMLALGYESVSVLPVAADGGR